MRQPLTSFRRICWVSALIGLSLTTSGAKKPFFLSRQWPLSVLSFIDRQDDPERWHPCPNWASVPKRRLKLGLSQITRQPRLLLRPSRARPIVRSNWLYTTYMCQPEGSVSSLVVACKRGKGARWSGRRLLASGPPEHEQPDQLIRSPPIVFKPLSHNSNTQHFLEIKEE